MTFAQKRKLKKEFMPKYYRNYTYGTLIATLVLMVALIAIVFTLAFTEGEPSPALVAGLIAIAVITVVFFIVIFVLAVKMPKKLIKQRTEEVEAEFVDMPFAEAEAELTQKKVITENGFLANCGGYAGQLVVPFKDATVSLHGANIYTKVVTAVLISDLSGNVQAEYILDRTLYNYILKKGVKVDFHGYTSSIVSEKDQYIKKYIAGDSDKTTMTVLFGMLGAFLSDEGKNLNSSKKIVLNVLSKEIK